MWNPCSGTFGGEPSSFLDTSGNEIRRSLLSRGRRRGLLQTNPIGHSYKRSLQLWFLGPPADAVSTPDALMNFFSADSILEGVLLYVTKDSSGHNLLTWVVRKACIEADGVLLGT